MATPTQQHEHRERARAQSGIWRVIRRGWLSRARTVLIWSTAGGVILLAVLVTALRLALPMAGEYREQVAMELGERLGYQVRIGDLDVRWRRLSLRVFVDDVAVIDDADQPPLLQVRRLDFGVQLWQSVRHRQLRFESVRVLGADVHLNRDSRGRFSLSGAGVMPAGEAALQGERGARLLAMLAGTGFRLESSRLRYTDQLLQLDYRFDDLNLNVAVDTDALRLAGQVFLPPELGRVLTLGMDLRGDPEDPETWHGDLHVRGQGVLLNGLPDQSLARRLNVRSGLADLELWGRMAAGRLDRVRARTKAEDVRLGMVASSEGGESPGAIHLERIGGDVLWEARGADAWQLALHDVHLQQAGRPSATMGLSLAYQVTEGEPSFWGEAEGLRLDEILPLVLSQDLIDAAQRARLEALSPAGELPWLRFHWQRPEIGAPKFAAAGGFRDVSVAPHDRIPGVYGLDGEFRVFHDGGQVRLASHNLRLDLPRLFADSLPVSQVIATLDWTPTQDGHRLSTRDLHLHNEDVRAVGELDLELGSDPRLDLVLRFADGDGGNAARYLPVGIMPQNTYRWLDRSIISGHVLDGQVVYRGPLRRFPLDEGEFQVRARVVDGVLAYQPGWPEIRDLAGDLIFDDRGMRAENASGQVFGARVSDARVRIGDFRAAVLELDGRVDGPLGDLLRYVRESPLARGLDPLLDDTRVTGPAGLELSLHMPLHRAGGGIAATRVTGAVELPGNDLQLAGRPVEFTDVRGRLEFTHRTVRAQELTAILNRERVSLGVEMPEGGPLRVDAEGVQPVSALAAHLPGYLSARLEGRSHWNATLTVPTGGSGGAVLNLESALEGVRSRLPDPLTKSPEDQVPFRLELPLGEARAPLRLRYGAILSGVLAPAGGDGLRGEFRFNDGAARMPDQGLRLAGRLDRLDLDEWRAVADGHDARAGTPPPEGRISGVELNVREVHIGDRGVRDVRVTASRDDTRWLVWVDSLDVRGDMQIPRGARGATQALTFNIEHIDLDGMLTSREGREPLPRHRLDPRVLPGLRGGIGVLVHEGRRFSDIRIEATPLRDGLQIHYLQAASAGGHARVRVTGDWRVAGADQHQTRLRFDLNTPHIGRMLTELGFQHGFDQGEGRLEGQVRWPDAPTHFTWAGLQGSATVELKDGRLVEVEPGAGRLLGLFSLNLLPRRLSLDFRDVFQRGFLFDTMAGTVRLVGSDAYTSDLRIIGVAADVEIAGRTGIVARDHDQRITVTPRVGAALPVAGALLGGPVTGAAVFLLDRVLGMGRSIDEASRVEYRVTGSWQDPLVETVARSADNGP